MTNPPAPLHDCPSCRCGIPPRRAVRHEPVQAPGAWVFHYKPLDGPNSGDGRTCCGIEVGPDWRDPATLTYPAEAVCRRCLTVRERAQEPRATSATVSGGEVTPLPEAKVYRVVGTTDVYTVVVGPHLAICTCLAGKTRPDVECKHVRRVREEDD